MFENHVQLTDVVGAEVTYTWAELFRAPGFSVISQTRAPLPPQGLLDGLPPAVVEQARWWEHHIVEVLTGIPPETGPAAATQPQYDPASLTLRQREVAKIDELSAAGHSIRLTTFQRLRFDYEKHGIWGLVDHRITRTQDVRTDERVLEAIRQAVAEETNESTGTVERLRRRVERILISQYKVEPVSVMPSRATFYRLVQRVSAGKHTFGSARTRRSLAKQPAGPFGTVTVLRPGEWMQIDSTPLDVRVVLDNGIVDKVELTWLIDLATRTIAAAVLRPTTKAVDAALLLARSLTPEPMRPGWADALRMSRSVLPHRRLTDIDQRLEHAAARPVIVPETIVCDHAKVYMSQNFRTACRAMGINFQPTHKGSPWEKGTVEKSFSSVGTLFAQYVAGYVGNSVENRGKNADQKAVWSMIELQEILDEWIVVDWQNRQHDGLRHPLIAAKAMTPNEQYAALIEITGYAPVPLSADDYVELLPAKWRVINSYGIKIKNRKYDGKALNPHRREHSGVTAENGRWEIHYDPYDVSRIWVRNHRGKGWICVPWTHLRSTPVPFGEQAWDHARQILARRGENPATEKEIAEAVTALLDKAGDGPSGGSPSVKTSRVAGRTRAMPPTSSPELPSTDPSPPEHVTVPADVMANLIAADEEDDDQLADVIPLKVFDPNKEAKKWW
ncbi:Mu transposase C-terminal domain-containing protein [Streptosporangium sp. NPDC000563]|uniref:Mu transposase C-terminal domain-containing protein n=1 Tax=Streptosporangium sp. NPDC000563 TaxID=3154366 RepID=UPI00331A95F9